MAAFRPRIADEFMTFIKSLREVKGLLGTKPEQAIGMPLKLREVIEKRRLHALRLGGERFNGRLACSAALDDAVGFFTVCRQSRGICESFLLVAVWSIGTKPSS